ncbi:MAG: hypothetical protein EBR23_01675 [Planctomycetia bacterium]|nr:hypothetical protein [Planctomycetia bacterium]
MQARTSHPAATIGHQLIDARGQPLARAFEQRSGCRRHAAGLEPHPPHQRISDPRPGGETGENAARLFHF